MRIYYTCDIFHLVVDLNIISKQEAPTRPLHTVSPRNVATYILDPQYMYSQDNVDAKHQIGGKIIFSFQMV